MQSKFISTYQQILRQQPLITGLWLLHGDEPLVQNWLIDAMRPLFIKHNQVIKRIDLHSKKDWELVIAELDNLSLFAEHNAIIVSGKQKPSEVVLQQLTHFANSIQQGNSKHCLIYTLPRQDKKAQASPLFQLFATKGHSVDCHIFDEATRHAILAQKAKEFNIQLDQDAWHLLMTHTEHHLVNAYQTLWRLSDLYPNSAIDPQMLTNALSGGGQYSVFDLCDTLLIGDGNKALQILSELKQTTASSIVLWAVAKEIRHLLQLQYTDFDKLNLWKKKQLLYQKAKNRHSVNSEHLKQLYAIDQVIKGLHTGNEWTMLANLCLEICLAPKKSIKIHKFT